MPFVLSRLLVRLGILRSWATPVAVALFVFVTSWPLMYLVEPASNPLLRPTNFWWYFVVTASTVGYGDFTPETTLGHVVGVYVIIGGITAITTVFTNLAAVLDKAKGRFMQGSITSDAAGHVVLVGYTPGRTERIVEQLFADGETQVVLCAWDEVGSHPMPEHGLDFVRGDLTDEKVLRRAGVHRARSVLVDARDDNEALAVALTVDHARGASHLVVTLRDMRRASLVTYVDHDIRCVQWHAPRMITEELTSPGITEVYTQLMGHGGANTYSTTLPASLGTVSVGHCQTELGRQHGATLLAARTDSRLLVSPSWHTELPPGAVLYYVSPHRLSTEQITRTLSG
ncbi:MAG: ion channel [Actinocatenispora sp.]